MVRSKKDPPKRVFLGAEGRIPWELLLGSFCFGDRLVSHFGFLGSSFFSAGSFGRSSFLSLHFLGFSSLFHFHFLGISSFVSLGVSNWLDGCSSSGSGCSSWSGSSGWSSNCSRWLGRGRCSGLGKSAHREQTGDQGGENFVHFENPR